MNNMLFEDFITIQGHRFLVMIDHNGVAEWDDHEGRVGQRSPGDSQLELQTASGDAEARRRLANEFSEFTVRTKLDPVTLQKFKDWEPIHDANFSTDQMEREIDDLLEEIFWRDVNPYLTHPLTRTDAP